MSDGWVSRMVLLWDDRTDDMVSSGHAEVYYTPIFVLSLFADHTLFYIYIFYSLFSHFLQVPCHGPYIAHQILNLINKYEVFTM